MSRAWQLPNPTRFGTDDFSHRLTLVNRAFTHAAIEVYARD